MAAAPQIINQAHVLAADAHLIAAKQQAAASAWTAAAVARFGLDDEPIASGTLALDATISELGSGDQDAARAEDEPWLAR